MSSVPAARQLLAARITTVRQLRHRASGVLQIGWVGKEMDRLLLQVLSAQDSDAAELADLAGSLQAELLELDVPSARPLAEADAPASAKGTGQLFGWLVTEFGTLDGLRAVLTAVAAWVTRTGRAVEVSLDGDTLKVTRATAVQQQELIDAWLARHSTGS